MGLTKSRKRKVQVLPLSERGAFKLPEAAAYCGGLSEITIRRLIARGLINPNRAVRHIVIAKSELDRFLTGNNLRSGRRK